MTLRDWVLIVSVCVNFVSVAVTVWTWRRSQEAARLQAQMERSRASSPSGRTP
jgi:hypothetical protein